jgi:hypothetical protein
LETHGDKYFVTKSNHLAAAPVAAAPVAAAADAAAAPVAAGPRARTRRLSNPIYEFELRFCQFVLVMPSKLDAAQLMMMMMMMMMIVLYTAVG